MAQVDDICRPLGGSGTPPAKRFYFCCDGLVNFEDVPDKAVISSKISVIAR